MNHAHGKNVSGKRNLHVFLPKKLSFISWKIVPKKNIFSITACCYLGRENFPLPSCAGCTGSNCIGCCLYQQEAHSQFQKTSLTLLTELICLSSCIFIWQCWIKVTCIFFCVCFTTCIFLRGYWTKRTCAIRLHLDSNWSDFSDWGISQIGIKHISPTENPQQKLKRYLLQASWLQSRCNFFFSFFVCDCMNLCASETSISAAILPLPRPYSSCIHQYL